MCGAHTLGPAPDLAPLATLWPAKANSSGAPLHQGL